RWPRRGGWLPRARGKEKLDQPVVAAPRLLLGWRARLNVSGSEPRRGEGRAQRAQGLTKNLVGNEGGIAGRRRGGGPPLRCVTRSGTERAPRPRVRGGERARPSEPRRDARTNDGSRAAARCGPAFGQLRSGRAPTPPCRSDGSPPYSREGARG